jgi:hypothetical protein
MPLNWDRRVRVYTAEPETCGKNPLRAIRSLPTARITPASATHTVSLSPAAILSASESDSTSVRGAASCCPANPAGKAVARAKTTTAARFGSIASPRAHFPDKAESPRAYGRETPPRPSLPKTFAKAMPIFRRVSHDHCSRRQQIEDASGQVDADLVQIDVATVQIDIATVQIDVASVQIDIASVQIDVASVQIDVASVQIDIASVQIDVAGGQIDADREQIESALAQIRAHQVQESTSG